MTAEQEKAVTKKHHLGNPRSMIQYLLDSLATSAMAEGKAFEMVRSSK